MKSWSNKSISELRCHASRYALHRYSRLSFKRSMKLSLFFLVATFLLHSQDSRAQDDDQNGGSRAHVFSDLDPRMDGETVTVKFKVTGTYGIAQLHVPGQSPTFGIRTEEKRLTVWIKGELANVFDRFQMSHLQTNQLKQGMTIVATGGLVMVGERESEIGVLDENGKPTVWIREKGRESYILYLKEWEKFRIVSGAKPK